MYKEYRRIGWVDSKDPQYRSFFVCNIFLKFAATLLNFFSNYEHPNEPAHWKGTTDLLD